MASTAVTPRVVARPHARQLRLQAIAADSSFYIPAGYAITGVIIENTTANAVTGGIDIGVTDGGTTVVNQFAVGANAIVHIPEASLLLRFWSRTVVQQLFLIAHTAWNSASLNVWITLEKLAP